MVKQNIKQITENENEYVNEDINVFDSKKTFNEFWDAYPRKKAKKEAVKAWDSVVKPSMIIEIMGGLEKLKKHDNQWKRGFIPNGATFLRGERWKDEPQKDIGKPKNPALNYQQRSVIDLEEDVDWK